jgi:hypothetical protein
MGLDIRPDLGGAEVEGGYVVQIKKVRGSPALRATS